MICFLLALTAFTAAQPAAAAFHGQVSGIVVDHLSNSPLNHVLVQLTPTTKGLDEFSTLTSSDGAFLLDNVLPGKYRLTAQKRGQSPQAYREDGFYGTAVVVGPGKASQNLVFSMRAPASIRGLVLDDDGNPMLNASVSLLRQMVVEGESTTRTFSNSTTDAAGQFKFSHLVAGNYYLAAQGTPGGIQPAKTVYPVTFYGDTRDADAARVIHLAEGDAMQIQLNLHAVPAIEVHLPDTSNVNATLYVAGPQEAIIRVNTSFQIDSFNQLPQPTNGGIGSSVAGLRSTGLSGLAAGHYLIKFNHFGRDPGISSSGAADLADGMTLNAEMVSGSAVKGHVTFDTAADKSKRPRILLYSVEEPVANTEVNADGSFGFGGKISAGIYEIHMNDPSFLIASVTAEGARMIQGQLQIPAGGSVKLTVKAATRKNLSSLDGFVRTAARGAEGMMVLLVPQDLARSRLFRRDQSDSDGSFSMRDILPGHYTLLAIEDGHDLPYKNPQVIQPYLAKGVSVTLPLQNEQPVNTSVQKRLP